MEIEMQIAEFQDIISRTWLERDRARGLDATFMWLMEEVGELAAALREGTPSDQQHEFGDVLAWLFTVANVAGVDLERAAKRYRSGCPTCGAMPCTCSGKP